MQARGEAPPFAQKGASTLALAPKWANAAGPAHGSLEYAISCTALRKDEQAHRTLCIDRQDTPTRAVTRFKQVKIHAGVVQQARRVQTGKTCPDDGNGGVGQVLAPLCKAASVGFGCLARLTA